LRTRDTATVASGRPSVQTVPVSDSGFIDEPPSPGPVRKARDGDGARAVPRRRPRLATVLFAVAVVALLAFAGWAWTSRIHADDLAAWDALSEEIEVMDRSLTPLGHSEIPPCRDEPAGTITRTYPPSSGPQAEELVGYLLQKGWTELPSEPPSTALLTRTVVGHVQTIDVVARTRSQLVELLTAHTPGSAIGCLGR
jgi:hypothetical protein